MSLLQHGLSLNQCRPSAISSPKILELSGIGCPKILSNIGVDVKVELPGVGENVQEHVFLKVSYELSAEIPHQTFDLLADPVYGANAREL